LYEIGKPMKITMVGHSTILIETQGKRILTDPFFKRWGNLAYKRTSLPAMSRKELADVDIVLVSHSHFDHIDRAFLGLLPCTTPVLAPRRMPFARLRLGKGLIKVDKWEKYTFGGIVITAVPAVHSAITNGFVIESDGLRIYFAADTYFNPFMTTLRQKFQIDLALMPVTAFRIPMTMGEKQAVEAVKILEPGIVIPIHLGIKPRSPLLRTRQTPEGFARRLEQIASKTQVVVLQSGASWSSENSPAVNL